MCGEAWSNGQHAVHACVLVLTSMVDILSIYLVTVNLFSLHLMNFIFHTTLDKIRVDYKSVKCDVLFS